MYCIEISPFQSVSNCKAQAIKVLEEAGEIVDAWKRNDRAGILEEAADIFQATVNLLEAVGVSSDELQNAIGGCKSKNENRGYVYETNISILRNVYDVVKKQILPAGILGMYPYGECDYIFKVHMGGVATKWMLYDSKKKLVIPFFFRDEDPKVVKALRSPVNIVMLENV